MTNLVMPVETLALPILIGAINLINIEAYLLTESRESILDKPKWQRMLRNIVRCAWIPLALLSLWAPFGVSLYWASSAGVALFLNLLMKSPRMKQACGIIRLKGDPEKPYQNMYKNLLEKFERFKPRSK